MEDDFNDKMEELRDQFKFEKEKKAQLDKELNGVKKELDDIEIKFP